MGGYITFPAGVMTALSAALVLHEQNSIAGLANKVLAKFAKRVLSRSRTHCRTPNGPATRSARNLRARTPEARYASRSGPLHVLVVGGSLGAAALNEVVPRALALLAPGERPRIVHQAGAKHIDALKANYEAAGAGGDDVRSCRSSTTWRAPTPRRSRDLPLRRDDGVGSGGGRGRAVRAVPHAVDDHQTTNARFSPMRARRCWCNRTN
jgi:UDP-N-acetylglucosamine--N-acetylmuramyl-(pentapeptide) pyrophosphoryl-undecaprenol N-acetylglucosamine transferase